MMTPPPISLTVDAVVFGYTAETGISVLLIQRKYEPFKESWALPGGFVLENESLEDAVARELEEETGVEINYLEQLYTFGRPDRDPRNRIVSVAYFALVRPDAFELSAKTDASDAQWFPIMDLPELAFDHDEILSTAIQRLRAKITYEPIGFELLEKKFPFPDLEELYRNLLLHTVGSEKKLDRRNFKKKMMRLGILEELDEYRRPSGAGRPARLFRFIPEKYFALKERGDMFEVWL